MARLDFVVRYDDRVDSTEDLRMRILHSIFVKRVKGKKPVNAAVIADSGEGKSWAINRLAEDLANIQKYSISDDFDFFRVMTVANPLDYSENIDKILFDPKYKKLNILIIHEAKMVVDGSNWRSFVNMAIANTNTMARRVKPLMSFIISQYLKDIDPKLRPSLTHYITLHRSYGKKPRMRIYRIWKDQRDLEKPRLRHRKIRGVLLTPNGTVSFEPDFFEMDKPSESVIEWFEKLDYEGKSMFLKNKIKKINDALRSEIGDVGSRVEGIVAYYIEHPELISTIGKRSVRGWKLRKEARNLHDFSIDEERSFQSLLNKRLKETDYFEKESKSDYDLLGDAE